MIKCPAWSERQAVIAADSDDLKHHGAENSPLKNSAPSSLTAFNTSESTSIVQPSQQSGVWAKHTGRSIKYSSRTGGIVEMGRPRRSFSSNKQISSNKLQATKERVQG